MSDVNANIGVNIDTSDALSQLKNLQRQISQFHTSVAKSSETAALAQRDLQRNLVNSINAIQGFSAEMRIVKTSAESFTSSLEKNKFSMRDYFRYAGASTKTFGKLFKSEFDTINKVAEENVKKLQTQYIKLGRDSSGAMKAIAVIPNELNMKDFGTQAQIAAQKQALFNQLIKQGSTNLLNFGKNTQWAGRQLMVGFTLPLASLGTTASKTFMDMESAAIKFKKVYGDMLTPASETQAALDNVTTLGKSFTKYGIAVKDTVALAADAAAAGFKGMDLQRQTAAATKLSVLGQIDQQKALETTIALQNAFRMSSEDLASSIDFLNAVENQTVTSLDDITTAIPKVAPVIQSLGGNVKDLAFFLTAMKEGGVNASEGANALKSGLASLINPTTKASAMLQSMGINIEGIVEKNKGNLKATVIEFAKALDTLNPLARARAIEQMFGKFQFARLSTLFQNVTRDGTQASRVLNLAGTSIEDLASLSEQELGVTADSAMNKFKKAIEDLKVSLVPVGKAFLEAATPIVEFVGKILDKFDGLSSGVKKAITIATVAIGAIGPIALMSFGLLANGIANIIKLFGTLRAGYLKLTGQSQVLGEQTTYLTQEQIDASAAAHSLDQSHARLVQTFTAEASAVAQLKAAYESAAAAGARFAMNNPGMMRTPKGYANGISIVPGSGSGDTVPAMLTPGEAVIPVDMVKKYGPLINGMVAGNIPGYAGGKKGGNILGQSFDSGFAQAGTAAKIMEKLSKSTADAVEKVANSLDEIMLKFKETNGSVKDFGKAIREVTDLKETDLPGFNRRKEGTYAPGAVRDQRMAMTPWGGREEQLAEKAKLAEKFMLEATKGLQEGTAEYVDATKKAAEKLRQLGYEPGSSNAMSGTSVGHLTPQTGKSKTWEGATKDGEARLQAEDSAINKYLSNLQTMTSEASQKHKDMLAEVVAQETKQFEGDTSALQDALKRLMAGQQPRNRAEYALLGEIANADLAQRQKTGFKQDTAYVAEFGGSAASTIANYQAKPGEQSFFNEQDKVNAQYQMFGSPAELQILGEKNGIAYSKGVKSTVKDIYTESRDRNSPHRLTAQDGKDDANSYETAVEQTQAGRRKGRRVSTGTLVYGDGGYGGGGTTLGGGSSNSGNEEEKKKSTMSLAKMNSALMGTTFALTSLAGVGSMFGGTLGDLSQQVFKYSGLLFALMNITQLLTQAQIVELATKRASNVANAMGAANVGSLFSKGGGIAGFGKNLLTAGKFALRFAGGIGLAITAITAAIAIFNFWKKKNEEARDKVEGLGNAAELTDKKLKSLGDYFGVTATKSAFERGTTAKGGEVQVGAQKRTQLEGLKADKGFQEAFGKDIKALKGATDSQAKLIFDSLAIDLKGKGYAQEQIQTIITALQEEAGKTKVKFDVKSIDISSKEGQARMAANAASLTKRLGASLSSGMETVYRQIYDPKQGKWLTQPFTELSDGAKKNLNLVSKSFTTMMSGLSGQLEQGTITAEQFNTGFQAIGDSIKNMPKPQALVLMKSLLNSLPEKLRTSAASIGDVSSQLLLLKAQAAGVAVTAGIIDAMLTVQNTKVTGPDAAKKVAEAKTKIAEFEKQINVAAAAWKKLNAALGGNDGGGGGGSGKKTPLQQSIEDLKAEKVALTNQISAYNKLKKAGYDVKTAMDLASDSVIAAAVAAMTIKKGSKEWVAYKKLLDEVLAKRKQVANTTNAVNAKANTDADLTSAQNKVIAMQQLIANGVEASRALDAVGNEDFMTLIMAAYKAGTGMQGVANKINAIQDALDQVNQMGDPFYAINKAVDDFQKAYDVAMEDFRIQEQKARNAAADGIAGAEQAVKDIQTTIDSINKDIDGWQNTIIDKQREIELTIDRPITSLQEQIAKLQKQMEDQIDAPIKKLQDSISSMQRDIELQFDRPLKALSDESTVLSHDLTLIERQEKKVNDQFDAQQTAMEEINKLNQENIQQNKTKLSIADALSQGDISAAASAIQDLKAQQAAARAQEQQSALEKSRKDALDKITYNGKTRAQIEERQWQISQLSYALEQKKAAVETSILASQDQIYKLEQGRTLFQDQIAAKETEIVGLEDKRKIILSAIQVLEDKIWDKQNKGSDSLRAQNEQLVIANGYVAFLNAQLEGTLTGINNQRKSWEDAKLRIDEAKNAIEKSYTPGLEAAEAAAKKILDAVKALNTTVTTTHIINTICGGMPTICGGSTTTATTTPYTPPPATDPTPKPDTTPTPTPTPTPKPDTGYSAPATSAPPAVSGGTWTSSSSGYSAPASSGSGFNAFGGSPVTTTTSAASVGMNLGVNKPITDIITTITAPATAAVKAVASAATTVAKTAASVVTTAAKAVSTGISTVASAVKSVVTKPISTITSTIGKIFGGFGWSSGGLITPKYLAGGGFGMKAIGTDTVPAMLTPGEYIISKSAADSLGTGTLDRLNNGEMPGSTLYNYNLNVTLNGGDMDAQEVANVVMNRLKQVENQKIRRQKTSS